MSQKIERPTLQGQRIKTRKRDEKEKFDPTGFRDSILQGFLNLQKQSPSPSADGEINEKQIHSKQNNKEQHKQGQSPVAEENGVLNETNGVLKNGTDDYCSTPFNKPQFENIYKFLDNGGSKLDYRRYGEVLFDILIAGGHLGNLPF